jgi:hypothetical protein
MKDKLEQIKNRWGNIDGMGIAHPILEDELEQDVKYLIQLIEQMKSFIEGNEFDLTPEFRRDFPKGL